MEIVRRTISELSTGERAAVENLIGHSLVDQQQVELRVSAAPVEPHQNGLPSGTKEWPWGNIYEGMTVEEMDDIHDFIVRSRREFVPIP